MADADRTYGRILGRNISGARGRLRLSQAAVSARMKALGFVPFLDAKIQAPIILTFHAPADPKYQFKAFYEAVKARGFILYPGKLTQRETFRIGCIGAIGPAEMNQAVAAVAGALRALGIASGAPGVL